ncbi:MAG: UDP-4-amino-4,6-dideoxy-N-acetyl-beta-L-altrosamine transaminase [Candidatus Saganbacteria bacterium]|nr:UDP-4-amino-4,6-dideoxy-N-acetyl-beta-L-altrosamine transaminase [Candidatus Saganbacteria bacterium]
MKIPYATQWIDDDDIDAVVKALKTSHLTQGPVVNEFEKQVALYCGAKYAVAVNSGTSALHAACFAAGIGKGDEVITSPITFVASANCVLYCGGKPVFADIQEDTVNVDPLSIEKHIGSRTKAIIPVHFAGHPCDMKEIKRIADKSSLMVIEDCCHALGAENEGSKIGSCKHSDMAVLSFHAVKHITTGEGGMVLTNNKDIYEKLLMFRTHGITRQQDKLERPDEGPWYYEMQMLGFNYRITDFQCALGISQLSKLEMFVKRRREIVKKYNGAFSGIDGLVIPVERANVKSAWHLYVLRLKNDRKLIFDRLKKAGIGVNTHYFPVYLQPYYQSIGYLSGLCPKAENYYSQAITLPLFPKMSDEDVETVIKEVKKAVQK